MTTEWVRITREQRGSVNGKPLTGRIYVTGPLFGSMDIFSSTAHEWQASLFTRREAEVLISRHWQHLNPEIEPVDKES